MKSIIYLYVLGFFLFPVVTKAQTNITGIIKGIINDDKGHPLPGVLIALKNSGDSIFKTTATSIDGTFSFVQIATGDYGLDITIVGFDTLKKSGLHIDSVSPVLDIGTIKMASSTHTLKEVSVTAQKSFIEKQIDKTVVNVDQNIANTGTNALELLKKLLGVQVSSDGQITLNGKSGVNVNLDNKTTYLSADDLANLLTNTPSSDIQKIEIMTNPSAKYDAEGTGGIINIIRKRSTKSGLNGSVTGSFGQGHYDRYNTGLVLNYKTDKYNIYLNNTYGYNKSFVVNDVTSDIMNGNSLSTEQVSTNRGVTLNKAFNSSAGIDLYLSKQTTLTLTGNVSNRQYYNNLTSGMTIADSNRNKTMSENFSALNADKPLNFTTGVQLLHKLDTAGKQWSADVDYSNYRYRPGQYNTTTNYDPSEIF